MRDDPRPCARQFPDLGRLYDYAADHAESAEIFQAID
jgi:hypothetical protein